MSGVRYCLHALLPKQRRNEILNSLRGRGHNYALPHTELTLFKNSFVNRCLFSYIWVFAGQLSLILCISSCLLFACFSQFALYVCCICNACVCHAVNKRHLTYLVTLRAGTGKSETEGLEWGWWRELGSWFQRNVTRMMLVVERE